MLALSQTGAASIISPTINYMYSEQPKKCEFSKIDFLTKQFYHYNALNFVTLGTNRLFTQ